MIQRQLARVGITLNVRLGDFSQLIEAVHNKKAPMFSFAWGSDYPDAENNLAIFYGPNGAPGSNSFNYKRKEFDDLYRKIRSMGPSPERTKIYEQMRDMLIEDVPYIGSMARTRYYLIHPWVRNCKPTETWWDWPKYLDVVR
jgi:oligopeptide transport system substrate-binding protein